MQSTQPITPLECPSIACCDFQLKTKNGTYHDIRSMEFPFGQDTKVIVYNRDEKFESIAPDSTKGFEWISKLGFAGFSPFGLDTVVDGLNEEGLSFGALTLDETIYQEVPYGSNAQALSMMDLGNWILGSFTTVSEVKEALKNVFIWGQEVKAIGRVPGLHFALHDAGGHSAVIEIINGEVKFYDNPNGVLTNDPQLMEQLGNLKKYAYLTPESSGKIIGEGMVGLPGDCTPKGRFVRISKEVEFTLPLADEDEALDAATHILNTVDIPKGNVIVKIGNSTLYETTLWTVVKDLSNRVLRVRPQHDMAWRRIDLTKIPLAAGTLHPKVSIQVKKPTEINITSELTTVPSWINNIGSSISSYVLSPESIVHRNQHGSVKKEFKINSEDVVEPLILSFCFFLSIKDFL